MQPPGNIHLCVLSLKLSSQEWTASASSYADSKPQISVVSSKRRPSPDVSGRAPFQEPQLFYGKLPSAKIIRSITKAQKAWGIAHHTPQKKNYLSKVFFTKTNVTCCIKISECVHFFLVYYHHFGKKIIKMRFACWIYFSKTTDKY